MKKNMTANNKRMTHVLCIIAFVILQIYPIFSNRFGMAAFNGVATALQYGICLLMILNDDDIGVRVASVLMIINGIVTGCAMIFRPPLTVLPGVANIIFYMITIIIIARANKKREIENITDMITGVFNRKGLYKLLNEKVESKSPFHLIYFTLDNFKAINDNYGPVFGDELLRIVAKRMTEQLGDCAIIARTAGTDFAVVVGEDIDAIELANKILECLKARIKLVVNESRVDCFIESHAGIASYPKHSVDCNDIITYADIAMLEAIQQKSDHVVVFQEAMAKVMYRQIEVEKLIKEALEHNYFYLVYQPQFHLDGKKLRGFETLIRMKTPDGTFVSPGEFIPVAEKGDLILRIDNYVLQRSMREFKQIVEDNPDLVISINVSAKNIGKPGFVNTIKKLLQESQFPSKNLEIEITEYCMLNSLDVTKMNIHELKEMGVQIALDDFGTGYTSLNYVSELPINLLKIDKSLVDDIESSDRRRQFVQTIISLGHLMGCEVISEGVELETQVNILKQDGCDFVQGFVWGKPLEYQVAKRVAYETANQQ